MDIPILRDLIEVKYELWSLIVIAKIMIILVEEFLTNAWCNMFSQKLGIIC